MVARARTSLRRSYVHPPSRSTSAVGCPEAWARPRTKTPVVLPGASPAIPGRGDGIARNCLLLARQGIRSNGRSVTKKGTRDPPAALRATTARRSSAHGDEPPCRRSLRRSAHKRDPERLPGVQVGQVPPRERRDALRAAFVIAGSFTGQEGTEATAVHASSSSTVSSAKTAPSSSAACGLAAISW